ncbi:MAG TPA: phage holin family protein [Planctomycetaceae bacterium]|nr:phage holin family protein [Planctomycetaceae bacterium]
MTKPQPHGAQAILALAVDTLKLGDLQVQLATLDVREFWANAWRSALLLGAGSAALLAALPVAMLGIAEYLRQAWSLPIEAALLIVAGVVLVAAGSLVAWSAWRLATAAKPLRRSADELRENLTWLRSVLYDESAAESAAPKP